MGATIEALELGVSYEKPPTREDSIDTTGYRAGASARTDNEAMALGLTCRRRCTRQRHGPTVPA